MDIEKPPTHNLESHEALEMQHISYTAMLLQPSYIEVLGAPSWVFYVQNLYLATLRAPLSATKEVDSAPIKPSL